MPLETTIKVKNDNPAGAALRVQYWNGKLPTYDSEKQRGEVLKAQTAVGVDGNGNPTTQDNPDLQVGTTAGSPAPNEQAQADANAAAAGDAMPDNFAKLKKAELVDLLATRKAAGYDVSYDEENDTVASLREKITGTYAAQKAASGEPAIDTAKDSVNSGAVTTFDFSTGALLQEQTIDAGGEKVLTITQGCFITLKLDA